VIEDFLLEKGVISLTNEEIDVVTEDPTLELTTVLGLKFKDALVMASDSQSTSKSGTTKKLDSTKIIQINKFMGLTGSGDSYQIRIVADEAKGRFEEKKFSQRELEKTLNTMIKDLHRQHNTLRSEELGYREIKTMFHPQCLVGAAHSDNTLGLYLIRDDAWVEPVDDYQIIGSGNYIGNFIISQQIRAFESQNMKLSSADVNYGVFLACYIINEIKNFDTKTGGSVNVAVIHNGGFVELLEKDVSAFYTNAVEAVSKAMGQITRNPSIENLFRAAYPKY
jgi:20S proteasome alpha/beta subunit